MQVEFHSAHRSLGSFPPDENPEEVLSVDTEHYRGRIDWEKKRADFWVDPRHAEFGRRNVLRILSTAQAFREGGVVLHAGAALHKGFAYLFCGPSGAGKTTTLKRLGWEVLHDDLVCVHIECGTSKVERGTHWAYPPISLDPPRHPIGAIFVLAQADCSGLRPLGRSEAMARLLLRPQIESALTSPSVLLERFERLVSTVPTFELALDKSGPVEPLIEEAVDGISAHGSTSSPRAWGTSAHPELVEGRAVSVNMLEAPRG